MDAFTALVADSLCDDPQDTSFVSPFFVARLTNQGYSRARTERWAAGTRTDFCADRIFFNINAGGAHWILAEVRGVLSRRPTLAVYDSYQSLDLGTPRCVQVTNFRQLLG